MPIEKLRPSFSFDEERLKELKKIAPEAFADGKINWEVLKESLGEHLEDESGEVEHFGLFWPGKKEARKIASIPSKGTLVPVYGEGLKADGTPDTNGVNDSHNIFIEGENLEVLKILQKSYAGHIKMIYIDPPYNTGKEFVYDDNFTEPLEEYLRRTGQIDGEGKPVTTNKRDDGRFHSKWLSMMYPRLKLARNLLKEDGVIFISIGDEEIHNLRQLCNEIFGEENFVTEFIWEKKKKPSFLHKNVGKLVDYILCYVKNSDQTFPFSVEQTTEGKKYPFNNAGNGLSTLFFPPGTVKFNMSDQIVMPQDMSEGIIITELIDKLEIKQGTNVNGFHLKGEWRYSSEKLKQILANNEEIVISKIPFRPNHIKPGGEVKKMKNCLSPFHYKMETNEDGTEQLNKILGGDYFDNPKPIKLIITLIKAVTYNDPEAILLDFFAGSGTTGQATLELNQEDNSRRRFILIQLPESIEEESTAFKAGYKNISSIAKERLRRAIKNEDLAGGFVSYSLTESNIKPWDFSIRKGSKELEELFDLNESLLRKGWDERSLLSEITLVEGFPLDSQITQKKLIKTNTVQEISSHYYEHKLFVCLDETIKDDTINKINLGEKDIFICLDTAISDQDKLRLSDRGLIKTI